MALDEAAQELVGSFARSYAFPLDDFQRRAAEAVSVGRSVLVCAPTGAGKTVVGEFGVWYALQNKRKTFYTTPLKALSNQKFGDFIARHGADNVGLLTGDNSINGDAPIVVMTTEVLRNMLYERSPALRDLGVVVMDEVHYLRDQYRGATWEEVLIHLEPDVQVVALSATVSNHDEFGGWLSSVRGPTDVIVEDRRPVPIEHMYMLGTRLHPMFVNDRDRRVPNPALKRRAREDERAQQRRGGRPRARRPDRIAVIERLRDEGLLPAITFIFSRQGCDQAVEMCLASGLRLTTAQERERIREYVELRAQVLPDHDLDVLGFTQWAHALEEGFAAHHAGMIPLFKETVEELFERALVKAVFATETLALGINMPAKTVVIERLTKWTGERHEMLTPSDYTQLTGRAGRRGMDAVGYGVTLQQSDISFDRIVELAEQRAAPLVSSFRPSYNMAVNLLRIHSVEEATRLLNLSFAQYLTDRGVVRQQRQIEKNERFVAGYREHVECDLGDFDEYWDLLKRARGVERESTERFRRERTRNVREAFERVRRGDVLRIRRGGRASLVAVVEVRTRRTGEPLPIVVTADRKVSRLAVRDFPEAPVVVGRIRVPRGDPRAPKVRHDVATQLAEMPAADGEPVVRAHQPPAAHEARAALREHPCHHCPDRTEHERWMLRLEELQAQNASMVKRVRSRTQTLARTFERVLDVLRALGYVEGENISTKGERLARIYNESDLLVAEALTDGVFDGLAAPELAAIVSTLVYETRIGEPFGDFPNERTRRAYRRLTSLYRSIHHAEQDRSLQLVREPDPGFIGQLHAWASGGPLEDVLAAGEMSAGDFVRNTKQVWDLLRQIAEVAAPDEVAERSHEAARAIYRGVVAYSGAL